MEGSSSDASNEMTDDRRFGGDESGMDQQNLRRATTSEWLLRHERETESFTVTKNLGGQSRWAR